MTDWRTHPARDPRGQMSNLQAEVESLRAQLHRAQKLATLGTMTAMVAHEFNNIITPIINYARMARKDPALIDKAIAHATDDGQRATSICRAILGIADDADDPIAAVRLAEVIGQTLDAIAREPARDCIELVLDAPDDLTVTTRRVELQQVLLNLILNARAAVLARTGLRAITISAEKTGPQVLLRVADNGVGIATENIERIFEPFFTTKSDPDNAQGGHGLGLAICRQITDALGGRIDVQSELGVGTTFTLRLPVEAPVRLAPRARMTPKRATV